MGKPGDLRSTKAWKRMRKQVLHTRPNVCSICGQTIDLRLPGTHRMGPTVDHIVAIHDGGEALDPANLAPAHNRCNAGKENKQRDVRRGRRSNVSRVW